MKKVLYLTFLIGLVFIVGFWSYVIYQNETKAQNQNIVSPLPGFLSITQNPEVSTINLWLPILQNFFGSKNVAPEITASSALLYDTNSEKVLFQKNPKAKLPMASLTKIMTAVVALENKKQDDKYLVHGSDLVGEDSMGLEAGEVLSREELLYGLMLHSGNDAAETLASNFKGGRSAFIKAMNDKAKSLGLKNTNFTNPTGLEGDGTQYTTAYDLVVITRYALVNFPTFRKISATFDYTISQTLTHKEYDLENETNLLTSYPGVKGVKTGFTPEAGLCLVTYLDYSGYQIIGVVLASGDRRGEMIELLDYSLKTLGIKPPNHG